MQTPCQMLRCIQKTETSRSLSALHSCWESSDAGYDNLKLEAVKPLFVDHLENSSPLITTAVLDLINKYQVSFNLDLAKYRIVPALRHRDEQSQLPQPPATISGLSRYTLQLASLPDFELTKKNRVVKAELFSSLKSSVDGNDKNLIKSILIHEITSTRLPVNDRIADFFRMLDYDRDTHYLLCLLYFTNPNGLERAGRLNQILRILSEFKSRHLDNDRYRIEASDWNFLVQLINTNLCTFNTHHQSSFSFLFSKLTSLITDVNSSYIRFDLIGMLRFLRNAESGYENPDRDQNTQKSEIVWFNINYFRFLVLERAIMEWNMHSLTSKTWSHYNFSKQWRTVWDMYYDNEQNNLNPPGGPTIRSQVKKIVGL